MTDFLDSPLPWKLMLINFLLVELILMKTNTLGLGQGPAKGACGTLLLLAGKSRARSDPRESQDVLSARASSYSGLFSRTRLRKNRSLSEQGFWNYGGRSTSTVEVEVEVGNSHL